MNSHRSRILVAAAAALCLSVLTSPAIAQSSTRVTNCNPATPNNALCLDVTAPTTNTDGSAISGAITYLIEQRVGTSSTWTTAGQGSATRYYLAGLAPGDYTFRGYAINNDRTSAASTTVSGTATAPPVPNPNPPSLFVVKVTISDDHAPAYRIASNGRSLTSTSYAEIPVGRSCGAFVDRWRGFDWHRVEVRNVERETWGKPSAEDLRNLAAPCAPRA